MLPLRDLNPSRTTPWTTWGLILTCVIVYIFWAIQPSEVQDALTMNYAVVPVQITAMFTAGPDSWTILSMVTSMFMHGGLGHIVYNLWYLWIFGDNVEDNFGHARYLLFYLLCGLAAVGTQWMVAPFSPIPMLGASGAIAGVLGAYVVLYPHARVLTLVPIFIFFTIELPALILIAVWFGLQLLSGVASLGMISMGGVAFWAHIGGFVAGVILTLFMRRRSLMMPAHPSWAPDEHAQRW